jgi:S1-C subfamily serine protease
VTAGLELLADPRSGSQLAAPGLREGDRLISIDGTEIGQYLDVQECCGGTRVGTNASLRFERWSGDTVDIVVFRVS